MGIAIGPFIGGWLIQAASWRLIFLINLPLAAVVVAVGLRHIPESRDPDFSGKLDVAGSVLVTLGRVGLTYGLIEGPNSPAPPTSTPRSSRSASTARHSSPPGSASSVVSWLPPPSATPARPGWRPHRPLDRCTAAWTHRPPGSWWPRPLPAVRRRRVRERSAAPQIRLAR
ncbi:MAG: hypothetical protein ACTHPS_15345 [Streptosporangiaceae bacterium]